MAFFNSLKSAIFDREERKQHYQAHIKGLNAYEKHKKFVNDYVKYYGKEAPASQKLPVKTDQDALREGYRFIRTEEDDTDTSWEQRLVKRYYDKLFKEYCIADMSKYKTGKVGLRWRTEKEVMSGKGQFICGNKHCDEREGLASFEVNFSYIEAGENKQALVKLVACESCADKLHYRRNKERERLESQNSKASKGDNEVDGGDNIINRSRAKSEYRDKGSSKRRRKRSSSADTTTDEEIERSSDAKRKRSSSAYTTTDEKIERSSDAKKKGKRALAPGNDNEEDEKFDEFLEGMFP